MAEQARPGSCGARAGDQVQTRGKEENKVLGQKEYLKWEARLKWEAHKVFFGKVPMRILGLIFITVYVHGMRFM